MYKEEEFKKCKQRLNLGIVLSILFFVCMITSLVLIGINVNINNYVILLIISLLIMLILGVLTIYFLIEYVYLSRIRIKFLKLIYNSKEITVKGKVISFDKQVTTSKYQTSFLVEIEENKDSKYTFYSEELLTLEVGNSYIFKTYNNYIVSFEVVKK